MTDDLRRRTVVDASMGAIMAPLAARATRATASEHGDFTIVVVDSQMSDGQYWVSLGAVRRLGDI